MSVNLTTPTIYIPPDGTNIEPEAIAVYVLLALGGALPVLLLTTVAIVLRVRKTRRSNLIANTTSTVLPISTIGWGDKTEVKRPLDDTLDRSRRQTGSSSDVGHEVTPHDMTTSLPVEYVSSDNPNVYFRQPTVTSIQVKVWQDVMSEGAAANKIHNSSVGTASSKASTWRNSVNSLSTLLAANDSPFTRNVNTGSVNTTGVSSVNNARLTVSGLGLQAGTIINPEGLRQLTQIEGHSHLGNTVHQTAARDDVTDDVRHRRELSSGVGSDVINDETDSDLSEEQEQVLRYLDEVNQDIESDLDDNTANRASTADNDNINNSNNNDKSTRQQRQSKVITHL